MRDGLARAVHSIECGVVVAAMFLSAACSSDISDGSEGVVSDEQAVSLATLDNDNDDNDEADDAQVSYPRYVNAKGAFTCDLTLTGTYPQSQVPPDLERDRMVMTRQPGFMVKYLPLSIDTASATDGQPPNLLSGGRYLFKSANKAANYLNFVENVFTLDGVQFLDRAIFLASECHDYAVVKAYEFTPLHDTHVLVRTERFAMSGEKPVKKLKALWPALQQEAGDRGMAAVWLIYNKSESIASVVYVHDRLGAADPTMPDFASLGYLESAAPLGHFLEELGWSRTFDRTHWILTIWHPFVNGDHGEPSDWPNSPPFGLPSCGDGVCEVSRGEAAATCSSDCPAQCGDGTCKPSQGENDHNCPGDCG